MIMEHLPTVMVYSHQANKRHLQGGGRRVHWYKVYRCPVCGRLASHRKQPIVCRGIPDQGGRE